MQWPRLLAYITGRVDKELLVRDEYLAEEGCLYHRFGGLGR
jgi:hypothetical protein